MPNDQLDGLLNRLVLGTGELTSAELEQLRSAIFGTPESEKPSALADIAARLDALGDSGQDKNAPCELQSAEDYLARVAAVDQPVPASLLRLVGAAPAARTTIQIANRGSRLAGTRRRSLLPWGSAIAATVLAGIFGYFVHDFVSRSAPAPAVLPNELANAGAPQSANGTVANAGAVPPSTAPAPTMAVNPPIPTTSHAVQASDYPPESVRLQEVGTVKVKYLVLKTGSVGQCQVEDSSGHPSLDDAACVMVKRWLFKPASLSDGTPVDWWLDAAITYNLVDGTAHSTPPQAPPVATAQAGTTQARGSYPKLEYWHDLLQLAGNDKGLTDDQRMDIYRLRLAVGDLKTDADFREMAQEALVAGYASEAKGVLDKAQEEKLLNGERDQRLIAMATDRAAQDSAAIADLQQRAATDPNSAVKLGLLYWSTGRNKEAEDAIRMAMTSGNRADPDSAKMALGHVLLSEGKGADAATAFASVAKNSKEANIARLWASYAAAPVQASLRQSRLPATEPIPTTSHAVTADDYPPVSIRLQEQGVVGIKYLVKEDGTVGDCNVMTSSGKARLDDAACLMVMRRWKFKPATQDGKPVAEFLTAEVAFQLK